MKAGRTLGELAAEIERQADSKRDFIAPARTVSMTVDEAAMDEFRKLMEKPVRSTRNRRNRGRSRTPTPQQPTITLDRSPVRITGLDGSSDFGVRPLAHGQIAEKLSIPKRYYDRLATEYPALLLDNVNTLMHASEDSRMFRTLDGNVRAMLSDRYRRMDYFDYLEAILPIIQQSGMRIESCQVTERKLYLKCVNERLQGKVVGDVVQAGLVFTDSEVGCGRMNIQRMEFTLACTNGMISGSILGKAHLGGRQGSDNDKVQEMLQDETKEMQDEVLWREVRDVTNAMLTDEDMFAKRIEELNAAHEDKVEGDVTGAVVELQKATKITDKARGGIMRHLIEGGDLSKLGMANAVTRYAQDVDSYDESTELEELGNKVIELPKRTWEVIANAEPPKVKAS